MGIDLIRLAIAAMVAILGAGTIEARDDICLRNHYILDVECPMDRSFGTNGLVYLGAAFQRPNDGQEASLADRASPAFIGDDEPMYVRTLAGGAILVGTRRTLTRVTPRGAVDAGFGYGQKTTSGRCVTPQRCNGVFGPFVVLDDGSIVVSMVASTSWAYAGPGVFGLVKLDANGKRDPSFGTDGVALLEQVEGLDDIHPVGLMSQPDGSLVVVGSTLVRSTWQYRWSMARFGSKGAPDRAFGAGGRRLLDRGNDVLPGFAEASDGKFYLGGNDGLRQGAPWVKTFPYSVTRFAASGEWDASFTPHLIPGPELFQSYQGSPGDLVQFTLAPPGPTLAVERDGSLLVVAHGIGEDIGGGYFKWADVRRVDPLGSISRDLPDMDGVADLVIDRDGFIVLTSGWVSEGSRITRYDANGGLDRSFGLLGKRTLPNGMLGRAIHRADSGRIFVAAVMYTSEYDAESRQYQLKRQPVLTRLRPSEDGAIGLVREFKQRAKPYYFYTLFEQEVDWLRKDQASSNAVWEESAGAFPAWAEPGPGLVPVCRFVSGPAQLPQFAHFFTADQAVCETIKPPNDVWTYEGVAFYVRRPSVTGTCPTDTRGLYAARNGVTGVPNIKFYYWGTYDHIESLWTGLLPFGWFRESESGLIGCMPD